MIKCQKSKLALAKSRNWERKRRVFLSDMRIQGYSWGVSILTFIDFALKNLSFLISSTFFVFSSHRISFLMKLLLQFSVFFSQNFNSCLGVFKIWMKSLNLFISFLQLKPQRTNDMFMILKVWVGYQVCRVSKAYIRPVW